MRKGGDISKDGITPLGMRIISVGAGVAVLGFLVLSCADAMGTNWAASLAPFLILGGYFLAGLGIFSPERLSSSPK